MNIAEGSAYTVRPISGKLPTNVDVLRTIAGLTLPIRCLVVQGVNVGSCSYADLCKNLINEVAGITAENCLPDLANWGIDCNCPFNIPIETVDGSHPIEIPDLTNTVASFMANGDFDITVKVNDSFNALVACYRFQLTVQKGN